MNQKQEQTEAEMKAEMQETLQSKGFDAARQLVIEGTARDYAGLMGLDFALLGKTQREVLIGASEAITTGAMLLAVAVPERPSEQIVNFIARLVDAGRTIQSVKTMPTDAPNSDEFDAKQQALNAAADKSLDELELAFKAGALPAASLVARAFIAGQKHRAENDKLNRTLLGSNG